MPAIVAVALRYIVMAAVQLGLWSLLEKYGIPLLNSAVIAIMEAFGVSEETAKDIMANKVLVAFEEVGVFAISLRSKMPLKVADYLGFTTKGWSLRKLSPTLASKLEGPALSGTIKALATPAEVEAVAKTIAASKSLSVSPVVTFLKYIAVFVGLSSGALIAPVP
jgi:hypothetical protein